MCEPEAQKRRKVIVKETRAELLIPLLDVSMVEIELPTCSSYYMDIIDILRDPNFDLNLFPTIIKAVEGCRAIK